MDTKYTQRKQLVETDTKRKTTETWNKLLTKCYKFNANTWNMNSKINMSSEYNDDHDDDDDGEDGATTF